MLAASGLAALVAIGVPAGIRGQAALRETVPRHDAAPDGGMWVRAGDVEVHVTVDGPGDGAPVVLVHGSGSWGGTWRHTLRSLADAGYRSYAVDLPPFGYSERPADGSYTTEAQAARIVAVIDALALRDVALVGHSFGGLATVEAATRTRAVSRLVLVDVALGLPADGSTAAPSGSPAALALAIGPAREVFVAATFTDPWFIPVGLRAFVADPAVATPEVVAMYRRPLVVEGTTRAISRWLPELLAPSTHPLAADPATYRAIDMPTLIVWGDADTTTPLAQGEQLRDLIPGAHLTVMRGIGHIPQIEDPDGFDRKLLRFLGPAASPAVHWPR